MNDGQIEPKARAVVRRRRISWALKQQIIDESYLPGASVSAVARRHDINANQLFKWRQQYGRGAAPAALIPVSVRPDAVPAVPAVPAAAPEATTFLEVEFPHGHRLRIHGRVDKNALRQVIELLR